MAKQNINPGQSVVDSAATLSAVQNNFMGGGKTFSDAFQNSLKFKKEREAFVKKSRDRANALIAGFDSYVDVAKFKGSEQTIVRKTAMEMRDQFANLANQASKIRDKTSPEYGDLVDQMEAIKYKMQRMKNSLESYAKYKIKFQEDNKAKLFSSAGENQTAMWQATQMIDSGFSLINDDGTLHFDGGEEYLDDGGYAEYSGFDYDPENYRGPFYENKEAAKWLNSMAIREANAKGTMGETTKEVLREEIVNYLMQENVLASLVATGDVGIFKFNDIVATVDGKISNEAIDEVADRIMNGLEEVRGQDVPPEEKNVTIGAADQRNRDQRNIVRGLIKDNPSGFSYGGYYFEPTGIPNQYSVNKVDGAGNILPVVGGGGVNKVVDKNGIYGFLGIKK